MVTPSEALADAEKEFRVALKAAQATIEARDVLWRQLGQAERAVEDAQRALNRAEARNRAEAQKALDAARANHRKVKGTYDTAAEAKKRAHILLDQKGKLVERRKQELRSYDGIVGRAQAAISAQNPDAAVAIMRGLPNEGIIARLRNDAERLATQRARVLERVNEVRKRLPAAQQLFERLSRDVSTSEGRVRGLQTAYNAAEVQAKAALRFAENAQKAVIMAEQHLSVAKAAPGDRRRLAAAQDSLNAANRQRTDLVKAAGVATKAAVDTQKAWQDELGRLSRLLADFKRSQSDLSKLTDQLGEAERAARKLNLRI